MLYLLSSDLSFCVLYLLALYQCPLFGIMLVFTETRYLGVVNLCIFVFVMFVLIICFLVQTDVKKSYVYSEVTK